MTGVSGSGKSSLAFNTIYAEGRRRYVESLSSYARQFLGGSDKPDVDLIEGLSPSVSIDQRTTSKNPRSTVGTVTEIYDFLRLLYARIGKPYCPIHNVPITNQTVDEIVNKALESEIEILLISTLMFASALKVKNIKEELNKVNSSIKIIVGGAPFRLNSNLWEEVGADAKGDSAADVIEIINKVVKSSYVNK